MKKSLLIPLFALSALAAMPLSAAHPAENYAAAQAKVGQSGYIVFIYPGDWDGSGKKLCRKMYESKKVQKAAGEAVLLLAPIYQSGSEKQREAAKAIMGSLGYPGSMGRISYPALVFYEKGGRHYSTVYGDELMGRTEEQVAETVRERLALKRHQDDLLAKANSSSGAEKARLLLESSRVDKLDWPGGLRQALRNADPNGEYGCMAALDFSCWPGKDESMEAYLKRVDAALENKMLTPWQKQNACAAALGHLRRSLGMMAGGDLIRKYATAMQKLDPESTLGLAAPIVIRDWIKEYRYGQGWSPETLPGSAAPVRMKGDIPIKEAGNYAVSFYIVTGRDSLQVGSVRLLDGEKCVASDEQERLVDYANRTQVFNLQVKKAVRKPVLEIVFKNDAGHRSTWGNIEVKKL
jgi:hypothetical protein